MSHRLRSLLLGVFPPVVALAVAVWEASQGYWDASCFFCALGLVDITLEWQIQTNLDKARAKQ